MKLTDKQYEVLLALFNEYNEAFRRLPAEIQGKFYDRLYDHSIR